MSQVKIRAIISVAANQIGIRRSLPLATLHHQLRVGQVGVAADVVEMQMRIDYVVDARGTDAACANPPGQLFTRVKFDGECLGQRADAVAIALKLAVKSGIENHPALGMLDQIARYRKLKSSGLLGQNAGGCRFEPSADHGMYFNGHNYSRSISSTHSVTANFRRSRLPAPSART